MRFVQKNVDFIKKTDRVVIRMNEKLKITRRGRPPVEIQWPDVVFTAQDVVDTLPDKVSRVTVHSKLIQAVDQGNLKIVGKLKTKNGRPRVSYEKCKPVVVCSGMAEESAEQG